ncbi:hypothetical protein [Tritonibacter mobilis]|uniref:hypothetical protein n=1 Tax=Tritonibacter mobilis TaxID=379347 RepID=UPI0014482A78|nr:hypothetical protein [Rhodobacteraceae bacterium R_SAG5]
MGIEFETLNEGDCLLCGTAGSLTGEHKIKASLLKEEFGSRKMVMAGKDVPKVLQSPRSKHVHFTAKICRECNSSRTQAADRAFDRLHQGLKKLRTEGRQLTNSNNHPNFEMSTRDSADYFRYFAKVICCFLAEVGGPRSRSLSQFALGLNDKNPIFLEISKDEQYEVIRSERKTDGFAKHGGLKFRFDDKKKWVHSIESSLSVGGIHYEFWVQLRWLAKLELHFRYGQLVREARSKLEQY